MKAYNFDDSEPAYSAFIQNNMGYPLTPISDDEHVAFLSYWLNAVVFLVKVSKCNSGIILWLSYNMKVIDFAWQS